MNRKLIACLIGVSLFLAWQSGVAQKRKTAVPEPAFLVGACTHFTQNKGRLDDNIRLMKQAGVAALRDDLGWRGVEKARGQFTMPEAWDTFVNAAVRAGIRPLLILDYGHPLYDGGDKPKSPEAIEAFCRYAEFVVTHFKGRVRDYEVWNEWDIGIGGTKPGDAESYVKLLKAVYPRVKKADPSIRVMGGAMTSGGIRKGWLEQMLAAGALDSLDAVSIHAYNYSRSAEERTPEAWAAWMDGVHQQITKHSGGREVPVYVTEMGWPTHVGKNGTLPERSAAYLARLFLLSRSMPYLRGVWWYDFQDDGWKSEYNEDNFGIVRPDGTPKPAYFALQTISALTANARFLGTAPGASGDIRALRFAEERAAKDQEVWAVWSAGDRETQLVIEAQPAPGTVVVQEAGRAPVERAWGSRDWWNGRSAVALPARFRLVVSEVPVLVRGRLAGARIAPQ